MHTTNMADPHQETEVDTSSMHTLSDIVIINGDQTVNVSGISEEALHHSLSAGNLEPSSMCFTPPTANGPDLSQRSISLESSSLTADAHFERKVQLITPEENERIVTSDVVLDDLSRGGVRNIMTIHEALHETNSSLTSVRKSQPGPDYLSSQNTRGEELHQLNAHVTEDILQSEDGHNIQNEFPPIHLSESFKEESQHGPLNIITETSQAEGLKVSQSSGIQISASKGISMTPEVLQSVLQQVKAQQLAQNSSSLPFQTSKECDTSSKSNSVSFTLVSPSQSQSATIAAPLGSSQNPIRIIQQGNRYTPMQQLTPEQLQQIMQVVQQQHTSKTPDNAGTVIFNPHTNTKIMYRVIYPSELHKSQASGQATYQVIKPSMLSQEQQTATPQQKRPYNRKRKDVVAPTVSIIDGDEDKEKGSVDAPDLSKEEKEERKKHRPRTRSGRVSKPPKHMVKDYKHIHVLDWDEDYDDSDGGYSDLKQSDEESKAKEKDQDDQEVSPDVFQALGAGKPKNFKCQTCEKSYIGQAGLERHYRLTPEHRRSDHDIHSNNSSLHNGIMADGEDSSKDASNTQDGNSSRNSDPGPDIAKFNGLDNFSEDSNTQDSINSTGTCSPIVRRGRGRGACRGRWAHLKYNAHNRRKNKLREVTKNCSDEDLMEVLFPRLVGSISTWEFLMMKAEKGGSRPKVDVIYREFENLLRPLKQVCADYMKQISEDEMQSISSTEKIIKVSDHNLASCLGLDVGMYKVEEMLADDSNSFSSLHNKLSAASITLLAGAPNQDRNLIERNNVISSGKTFGIGKRKFSASPTRLEGIPFKKTCLLNVSSEQSVMNFNDTDSNKNEPLLSQTTSSTMTSLASNSMKSIVNSSSSNNSSTLPSSPNAHLISSVNHERNPSANRALKSQFIPVVLNAAMGNNAAVVSSSQILPVILNSKASRGLVTSPALVGNSSKSGHTSALPLVLAAPGSHLQGGTILLTSGNQIAGQNVVMKEPAEEQKQRSLSSSVTKSQILGSIHTPNANEASRNTSSGSTSLKRFHSNTKPAEVKVSRKLFHEVTACSSVSPSNSSSFISTPSSTYMGNGNGSLAVASPPNVKLEYNNVASISSPTPSTSIQINSTFMDNHLQLASGSSFSTLKTELVNEDVHFNTLESGSTDGAQTSLVSIPVSDFNRVATSEQDEDLDSSFDISAGVLSSIGFSGDDLSSLSASSDNPSVHASLPALRVNQSNTGTFDISNPISRHRNVSHIQSKPALNGNSISSMAQPSNSDVTFINRSSSDFQTSPPSLKVKNNIGLQSSSQSSSSFMSPGSDFIQLLTNKPSSPLMASPCKESGPSVVTSGSLNLTSVDNSLQSQLLKSEGTPAMIGDLGALTFPDQSVEQLNGVSSSLHSGDVDNIFPEQMTQSDETVNSLLELPQQSVEEDMNMAAPTTDEDGQLLLTEGSNIYQTEDGTWYIQSADGNTYQLQGAQGLPLEAVQALLTGNLDLNGEIPEEGVQASVL